MIQIEFSPMVDMEIKRRHEELRNEAALERLVNELERTNCTQHSYKSKLLAKIGKELVGLGSSLEERYGIKPECTINPQ